jgi:hypothetical protein
MYIKILKIVTIFINTIIFNDIRAVSVIFNMLVQIVRI